MDFPRLGVFRAVACARSFSRAAESLFISQPAVSKHIRLLEAELGAQLLLRAGRRTELTDAGRIVDDYARRVFALGQEMRRALGELEGLRRGYLRIGASSTPGLYLLPAVLAAFRQAHPGIDLSLDIGNSQEIAARVARHELDIGFVGALPKAVGLQVQPFVSDEIVPIMPAAETFAARPLALDAALQTETLIIREAGSGTRAAVEAALAGWGHQAQRVMVLRGCEAVKRGVVAGLGFAFVSRLAVALETAQGVLKTLDAQGQSIRRNLYVLSCKDVHASAAALAFLALVRKRQP